MMREEEENIFMAKFCTKCGKRLIDGQPCSCTQTQQPVHDMQESVQKEAKDKVNNFFTQALEMIKHPVSYTHLTLPTKA